MSGHLRQGSLQPRQPTFSEVDAYRRSTSPGVTRRELTTDRTAYDVMEGRKVRRRDDREREGGREREQERERERSERVSEREKENERRRRRSGSRPSHKSTSKPSQPVQGTVKQPPIVAKHRREYEGVAWPPPGVQYYIDVGGDVQLRPPSKPEEHTLNSRSYLRTVKIENLTNN